MITKGGIKMYKKISNIELIPLIKVSNIIILKENIKKEFEKVLNRKRFLNINERKVNFNWTKRKRNKWKVSVKRNECSLTKLVLIDRVCFYNRFKGW